MLKCSLSRASIRWLRQHIGTVSQEPVLFCCRSDNQCTILKSKTPYVHPRSIVDNIRYARPSASDDDVKAAAVLANAHEFIR
jgi:ATP-binding cassette subfamily B protein